MSQLAEKTCIPCRGGVPPLPPQKAKEYLGELKAWALVDGHHLVKEYSFNNFAAALAWVNRIGELAEQQNHHPDIRLGWGYVRVEIWTHKIDGLTESDFVLAAKIDELLEH